MITRFTQARLVCHASLAERFTRTGLITDKKSDRIVECTSRLYPAKNWLLGSWCYLLDRVISCKTISSCMN